MLFPSAWRSDATRSEVGTLASKAGYLPSATDVCLGANRDALTVADHFRSAPAKSARCPVAEAKVVQAFPAVHKPAGCLLFQLWWRNTPPK
jgi:hypothetical protein